MGRELKYGHDTMVREMGETFAIQRGDVSHQIRGLHNTKTGTVSFPSEADVRPGDALTSVASREQFIVATVQPHVTGDVITYVEARYETTDQRVRRLAAERAQQPTVSIGTVQGSILNLTSQLNNVTQIIGALPNASQADKDTLTSLMQQLADALNAVPVEHAEDAETVSERAEAMAKEAKKAKPDPAYLTVSADGLKKAAATIAALVPAVLPIATELAERLLAAAHR